MDKLIIIFIICLTGCSLIGSSFGDVIEINSTRNKVEQDRTRMSSRDMTQVSAGLNYIWGVNQDMDIFMCKRPCTGDWNEMYGKLVQLDVDDHQVWGVNENDGIYVRLMGNLFTCRLRGMGTSGAQTAITTYTNARSLVVEIGSG